jgi:hypothetical protein
MYRYHEDDIGTHYCVWDGKLIEIVSMSGEKRSDYELRTLQMEVAA